MSSSSAMSGLASGVDTSSIVDQLMSIARRQEIPITNRQTRVTAEQNALKGIAAKLTAFQAAAAALKKDGAAFAQTQAVTSSDPSRLAAVKISGAGVGGHTVQVDRLAASAQAGYAIGDLSTAGTIQVGSTTFSYAAGATAAGIATQINASGTSPVYAAVVRNGAGQDRLVLSSRTTGESGRFTVTASALTEDPLYASAASSLNARYRVDPALDASDTVLESETNTVENAIPGLRLTFKGVTASPASVIVDAPDIDRDAVKAKVKAVVDAYNGLVTTTRAALDEKNVVKPSTTNELAKGTLFGDIGLTSMLSAMRTGLRDPLPDLTGVTSLADLGIDVPATSGGASTADAKQGKLVLDADKLDAALAGDWTKVSAFLDGFSAKVDGYVKAQTGASTSLIDGRVTGDDTRLKQISDQLTALNLRLDSEQKRLQGQFAAMETALGKLQSQQSWLTGQINSLP
jgi:flagellar hook-associated protein 2